MKMPWEDNISYNNTATGTASNMSTDYDFRVVLSLNSLKMLIDQYGRDEAVRSIGECIVSEYEWRVEKENETSVIR